MILSPPYICIGGVTAPLAPPGSTPLVATLPNSKSSVLESIIIVAVLQITISFHYFVL